jgi:hypothetical protein
MDKLDRHEILHQNVKTPTEQIKGMEMAQELNM